MGDRRGKRGRGGEAVSKGGATFVPLLASKWRMEARSKSRSARLTTGCGLKVVVASWGRKLGFAGPVLHLLGEIHVSGGTLDI